MPEESNSGEILVLQKIENVLDVSLEADVGTGQVGTLAQPGERRRMHLMALGLEERLHLPPTPASMPGWMNENVCDLAGRPRLGGSTERSSRKRCTGGDDRPTGRHLVRGQAHGFLRCRRQERIGSETGCCRRP